MFHKLSRISIKPIYHPKKPAGRTRRFSPFSKLYAQCYIYTALVTGDHMRLSQIKYLQITPTQPKVKAFLTLEFLVIVCYW